MEVLNTAHKTYLNGFKVCKETVTISPITAAEVFESTPSVLPPRKALPASAFLVPAVLDALRTSKYASITSVVPGEADLFCARAALEPNRTIFTDDSDLLLYDLGTGGEVVFFNQLELRSSHGASDTCTTLYAPVSQPAKIASRLGLRGLRRLAFEIREDKWTDLPNAITLAKQPMENLIASQSPSIRQDAFSKFEQEYDTKLSDFEAITKARMPFGTDISQGSFLDPRVSELVSRSPNPSSIFLPFLTDDFSRSSAWEASRKLRYFAYSCLVFKTSDTFQEQVSEYIRRGARIVEDDVSLLSREETIGYATTLVEKLEKFKKFLADFSTHAMWRPYALCEVFNWYVDSGRELPSKDTLTAVFSGTIKDEQLSWSEVHISAQLQAVLYSLRMLHQILSHLVIDAHEKTKTSVARKATLNKTAEGFSFLPELRSEEAMQLPAELLQLEKLLSPLPLLGELIPSRLELTTTHAMPAVEVEHLVDILFNHVEPTPDDEEGGIASKAKAGNTSATEDLKGLSLEDKERREEVRTRKSEKRPKSDQDQNNRFHVLGSERCP